MFSSMVNKVSGFWHSDPAAPSIEVNKPEDLTPEILKRYHDWFSANSNNEQVIQLLEDFQNNSAVRLGSDPQMCWQTLKNVMNHLENPRENIAQHLLKIVEQAFKTKLRIRLLSLYMGILIILALNHATNCQAKCKTLLKIITKNRPLK